MECRHSSSGERGTLPRLMRLRAKKREQDSEKLSTQQGVGERKKGEEEKGRPLSPSSQKEGTTKAENQSNLIGGGGEWPSATH